MTNTPKDVCVAHINAPSPTSQGVYKPVFMWFKSE